MAKKEKKLSRQDAAELYRDLRKTMQKMSPKGVQSEPTVDKNVAKQIAQAIREGMKKDDELRRLGKLPPESELPSLEKKGVKSLTSHQSVRAGRSSESPSVAGRVMGFAVVGCLVLTKIVMSGLEYVGVLEVEEAHATLQSSARLRSLQESNLSQYSKEEVALLKALDARRLELEERNKKIDQRERDIGLQEQELVVRLAEVRDLTEQLKMDREKSEKKRSTQLEQLSNVYGSMNPTEAAHLIEQLDVTIALKLLQRMPEKRIGQILALMAPERALAITRLLSGGKEDLVP
ncbi:MAG: hypothetical protein KDD60_07180 [Bdellovibrionales bacterium]|nr:hypothetical protein [Bdellovibrionales bacterium]